jgi:4-carboxymuconolactone decarboxylase
MDKATYDKGMKIRREVLGDAHVDRAMAKATDFTAEMQEMVTGYCWGEVWGREGLDRRTRSAINIAMLSILNRPQELSAHVRGALQNGLSREEIKEILLQVGIYGGVPAMIDSFRVAAQTLEEAGDDAG